MSVTEVCVPELVLNKTRQDETGGHFPNWQDQDNSTFFWSPCLVKSGLIYLDRYQAYCMGLLLVCFLYQTPHNHQYEPAGFQPMTFQS